MLVVFKYHQPWHLILTNMQRKEIDSLRIITKEMNLGDNREKGRANPVNDFEYSDEVAEQYINTTFIF